MNNGYLLDATAATNCFLFVKYQGQSSLEEQKELGLGLKEGVAKQNSFGLKSNFLIV